MNEKLLKKAFLAGFNAGEADAEGGKIICPDFYKEVTDKAYLNWRREYDHDLQRT